MIYPLLWMVVSSLRPDDLIFSQPGLWLSDVDLSHYPDGWNALSHPFSRYLLNSTIVVLGSVLVGFGIINLSGSIASASARRSRCPTVYCG